MNGPRLHSLMYNRLFLDRNGYTQEFQNEVNEFDAFVWRQPEFQSGGKYRCPRAKCKNKVYLTPNEVRMHLMYKSFVKRYWYWKSHGEVEPEQYDFRYCTTEIDEASSSSHTNHDCNERYLDRMEYIVDNPILANQNVRNEELSTYEEPFYNMVQVA